MPAPLAVDREAVKAHAIQHGVREAARAFELPESTVKSWSTREGWLERAGQVQVVQPLPKSMQPRASGASITPSEAAKTTMATLGDKTKSRLARGLARGALRVAHMKGETVLNRAPEIKALVDSAAKVHGWQSQQGPSAFMGLHVTVRADQAQVVDVDAEVLPSEGPTE